MVAALADYGFDDDDWLAVRTGVDKSDGDAGKWFEYPLAGSRTVTLELAHDPGTAVVLVRASWLNDAAAQDLHDRLSMLIDLLSRYRVTAGP
jgi:hypothetical protein